MGWAINWSLRGLSWGLSPSFSLCNIWDCDSSADPFLLWCSRVCDIALHLIFIIKSGIRFANHCMGLGHEGVVCAVCLTMFLSTDIMLLSSGNTFSVIIVDTELGVEMKIVKADTQVHLTLKWECHCFNSIVNKDQTHPFNECPTCKVEVIEFSRNFGKIYKRCVLFRSH